jgi:hypothetical protein
LINWRSKENFFHNVANCVGQHLIVVREAFMDSHVDQMSGGPCFNIFTLTMQEDAWQGSLLDN